MDTTLSILYKNTTAIALSVAKLKKDIEKTNSLLKEETTDLKNRNKITADNSKTYIEKLKLSTKSQIVEINKQIAKLNEELKKIDVNKEIIKELKPYVKTERLEQEIKNLQNSINNISLKEGKQGEKGKDGLNGRDGKNGTNGVDGKDGKDGKDGQDGLTPVITEVETETVGAGEFADVEIERNQQNEYKMKFKIPRGQKGFNGTRGIDGTNGQDGQNGVGQIIVDYFSNLPTGKAVGTKATVLNLESSASWETPTSIQAGETITAKYVETPTSLGSEVEQCYIWVNVGNDLEECFLYIGEEIATGGALIYMKSDGNGYVYVWQNVSVLGMDLTANTWNYILNLMEKPSYVGVVDYSDIPFPTTGTVGDIADDANLLYSNMLLFSNTPSIKKAGEYQFSGNQWNYLPYNAVETTESGTKFLSGDGSYKTIDIPEVHAVLYDTNAQGLTSEQQNNARTNISAVQSAWGSGNINKNLVTDSNGNVTLSDYSLGQIIVDYYNDLPANVPLTAKGSIQNSSTDIIGFDTIIETLIPENVFNKVLFPANPIKPISFGGDYIEFTNEVNDIDYYINYSMDYVSNEPIFIITDNVTGIAYSYCWTEQLFYDGEQTVSIGWNKFENDIVTHISYNNVPTFVNVHAYDFYNETEGFFNNIFFEEIHLIGSYVYTAGTPNYWKFDPSNVQPDWNQESEIGADYIKNKPQIRQDSNKPAGILLGGDSSITASRWRYNRRKKQYKCWKRKFYDRCWKCSFFHRRRWYNCGNI